MAENVLDKIIKKKIERIRNLKTSIKLSSLKDLIDKNNNFLNLLFFHFSFELFFQEHFQPF